jgi:catechol 2,3-dioxygenase-like lactoylglutathione lyase family enzyme
LAYVIPPRATVITLGARDLDALKDFYRGLGWTLAVELEGFAAFELRGAVLALFPLDDLASDAQVQAAAPAHGLRGFTIAINVDRREQVDDAITAVGAAGGRVTKPPVDAEWGGRSAYFADPEDNLWEVVWVPPESLMAGAIRRAVSTDGL